MTPARRSPSSVWPWRREGGQPQGTARGSKENGTWRHGAGFPRGPSSGEIRPTTLRWVAFHLLEIPPTTPVTWQSPLAPRRKRRPLTIIGCSRRHRLGWTPVACEIAATRVLAVPSIAWAIADDGRESELAISPIDLPCRTPGS
jgi:hypothetical protein